MRFIGWYPLNVLHFCIVMVSCCIHFYSYMYMLSLLRTPMRCLRFFVLCNCYIHVSRCPFSDIIYRKTKSKLFLSKMLNDSYLANSCKNCPSLLWGKSKMIFVSECNINFTAGWPQTDNVQLIKAGCAAWIRLPSTKYNTLVGI